METPLDTASRADLVLDRNTAETPTFNLIDENDTAIDFTGSTFKLQVKARDANNLATGSVLLTLITGSGIAGDVSNGEIHPTFPAEADSGLAVGNYIYSVLQITTGAAVAVVLVGTIDVVDGPTAP